MENTISQNNPEQSKKIDRDEALERAATNRRLEPTQTQASPDQPESVKNNDRTALPNESEIDYVEKREQERLDRLKESVYKQMQVSGNNLLFKDSPRSPGFSDKGRTLSTSVNDERVSKIMIDLAEAKGWKSITVSGHPHFKRQVWLESSIRGLDVKGYKPNEKDIADLNAKQSRTAKNTIERGNSNDHRAEPSQSSKKSVHDLNSAPVRETRNSPKRSYSGTVIKHGKDHYQHDPKEKPSYFVRLQTEQGEKTIWGFGIRDALESKGIKDGDKINLELDSKKPVQVVANERNKDGEVVGHKVINTQYNLWTAELSESGKVVQAVADRVVSDKVKDSAQRKAITDAINQRLRDREASGKEPKVLVYDKDAPAKTASLDKKLDRAANLQAERIR